MRQVGSTMRPICCEDADNVCVRSVVGKALATFQKSKSAWSTVASSSLPIPAAPESSEVKPDPEGQVAETAPPPPKQLTKRKGGLRTAKQLQEEAERLAAEARSPSPVPDADRPDPTVTVHRDTTGRIVDVQKLKEEERKREEDTKRKENEREEWGKGFVQRRQREERAKEEKEMSRKDVAR